MGMRQTAIDNIVIASLNDICKARKEALDHIAKHQHSVTGGLLQLVIKVALDYEAQQVKEILDRRAVQEAAVMAKSYPDEEPE
ncbi:hypothetical protein FDI24_gp214 [Acidovorax phage ACP17]|uniref:Uncharacterized protein n=1 Tax=Acidovorax phage ACP17 TaxID=2010329 RepID=A0A218M375_9CAUD|nr:hypothetical protein FDI24_gp214 [Acidovorax phage ACP17]ASD50495.1 hypothetical protein [Acidovorax phage ACP17]